ncbi:MAG: Hsp70 family protein, partial [Pseudaminobacter sp.]|nr:Hsp70 family protein [Pseudaminobacter sp.]
IRLTDEKLTVPMTRAGLNEAIGDAVQRVAHVVTQTLREARVAPAAITTLFLTGGSTAIPLLQHSVRARFPHASVVQGDMFGSVGLGLALDARRKFEIA